MSVLSACMCTMCVNGARLVQKMALDLLGLNLKEMVLAATWMLGIKLTPAGLITAQLSPAPEFHI